MAFNGNNGVPEPQGPIYLVLEKDLLISSDLVGALEMRPGARVILARTAEEIEGALRDVTRLEAAFLEMPMQLFVGLRLDKLMERLGASVIFTVGEDDADAAAQRGWGMLLRPFSDEMVYSALATLKRRH